MKTISREGIDEMTRRLVAEFQPEQVILFGSHTWGTPDDDSDVDLMVIVSNSDQSAHQRMVRALHCLSAIEGPKDVLVKTRAEFDFYRDVRASLEYKIVNEGKVLYERSEASIHKELAGQSAT